MDDLTHEINIDKVPPIMLNVGTLADSDTCYVRLVTHHLMLDQVGAAIVMAEIMTILSGDAELLTQPAQYRNILAHISGRTNDERARAFYQAQLKGINSVTSVVGITQNTFSKQVDAKEDYLAKEVSEKIRHIAQQQNMSPAVLFHTAFGLLMSVVSNSNDVVFGSVFSGRQTTPPGSELAVGMFMNTLPFRVKIDTESPQQLCGSVKHSLYSSLEHEHFPLKQAVQLTDLEMGSPLINAVLNYRRRDVELNKNDVVELLDEEDKMGSSQPLIIAVSDDDVDFYVTLKVDSRINKMAVWDLFNSIVLNLVNGLSEAGSSYVVQGLNGISHKSLLHDGEQA
jgi:hypothetical protein